MVVKWLTLLIPIPKDHGCPQCLLPTVEVVPWI